MLHAFSVENFKSLNTKEIQLFPLTILSGINNVGKTTFIKSILEVVRYHEKDQKVFSSLPTLSNYKTKVFNHDTNNKIKFHIKIDINKTTFIEVDTTFTYSDEARGGFPCYSKIFYKSDDTIRELILEKELPTDPYKIYAKNSLSLLYANVKEGATPPEVFEGVGDFEFGGYIPFQGKIEFDENPALSEWCEKTDEADYIQVSINTATMLLGSTFNVKYIGPLRSHPKEYYFFNIRGLDIDEHGENTIEVLERKQNTKIKIYKNLADTKTSTMTLMGAVQHWIKYFYKNTKFEIKPIAENLVQVLINGHTINNSGFGFSQLLPIIVQALLLKKDELLLLEQPEIHLHPDLEQKLAYFLLCIVKNNRQVIAETHSEHIVNELVLSKLKDESIEKNFGIYFLKKELNNITDFEQIKIGEYGEVENWPEDFFDQYLNFSKELVQLRREKALNKSQK